MNHLTPISLLRQRREAVKAEARDVLDQIRASNDEAETEKLEQRHDALLAEFDQIEAALAAENEDQRAKMRPTPGQGETRGQDEGLHAIQTSDYGWRDKEGRSVRVYRPDEAVFSNRAETRHEVGFGDTLRALALGARSDAEKRALAEGTDSAGGYTVPAPLANEYIDRLRANSVAIRAGVRTIPMQSKTLQIARLATDPTFVFRAENASVSEDSPTFSAVTFTAESCMTMVRASRELLEDSVNINEALLNAFAQAGALVVDRVILAGTGTSNEPTGILNTAGINTVSAVGTPTGYGAILDGMYELEVDNVPGPYTMVAHPRTWRTYRGLTDSTGQPLNMPQAVADLAKASSTQLAIDEGAGSNESSAILGNFAHCFLGMRNELRVEILKERYADVHQYAFVAHMRFDVQLAHPASFCALTGITNT